MTFLRTLLLIISFFAISSNAVFAKDLYILCPLNWKYSKSWFGKGKVFYDRGGEWIQASNVKITDDRIIVKDWIYNHPECNSHCMTKWVFSLLIQQYPNGRKYTRVRNIVTSPQCKRHTHNTITNMKESIEFGVPTKWAPVCENYSRGREYKSFNCKVIEK